MPATSATCANRHNWSKSKPRSKTAATDRSTREDNTPACGRTIPGGSRSRGGAGQRLSLGGRRPICAPVPHHRGGQSMSEQNKAIARQVLEAYNEGQEAALAARRQLLSPDLPIYFPGMPGA